MRTGLRDEQRAHGHQRFELDVQLRAEAAAEVRRADANAILGPAEQAADLGADERGTLRCRVDGQAVGAVQFGQRHHRLERRVNDLAGAERVLEDVIGLGESFRDVAAAHARVERHVGAGSAAQVLEIGEHARRLQHVVDDRRIGTRGRHLVEHWIERVVLDLNQVRGFFGNVRV